MKLKDWREREGLAQWQVAEQMTTVSPEVLGEPKRVTQQTVQTFETGRMPRKWHLQLLDHISAGAVQPNDFVDLVPEDAAKQERALIVQLCPRGREAAFEAAGWHTDERFADSHHGRYSAMMSRRRRPGEDWQALLAEIAGLLNGEAESNDERAALALRQAQGEEAQGEESQDKERAAE